MIAFIRGAVVSAETEAVVLDVQGVGYKVNVTSACAAKLSGQVNQEIALHTHLIVREDALQLYGFFSTDELNVFLLLLSVNGVGPRVALAVLSYLSPQVLVRVITLEDLSALTKVPGVGKKTAQRLVLELKDKFKKLAIQPTVETVALTEGAATANVADDVMSGLLALGYGTGEARDAVQRALESPSGQRAASAAELLKLSLSLLAKPK